MKFFSTTLAAIAAASILMLGAPQADAGAFKGKFKFTSKAPKEDIFGTATGQATLSGDIADITTVKGSITVPVKTMETGNTVRDDHLRSPDWLDEKSFPNIVFDVESVALNGAVSEEKGMKAAKVKVTGKFTLHGVTTPLTSDATIKWKDDGKAKITTSFTIALADYKVKGKAGIVGSKVGTTIACEATLVGSLK